ncbi:hypothetical protein H8D36_02560 [archaeon]|nr:hypothetical protein [archaeon]MBL7057560.1 hypothetical protein [Candidatus Woesearchaeota archaeon]
MTYIDTYMQGFRSLPEKKLMVYSERLLTDVRIATNDRDQAAALWCEFVFSPGVMALYDEKIKTLSEGDLVHIFTYHHFRQRPEEVSIFRGIHYYNQQRTMRKFEESLNHAVGNAYYFFLLKEETPTFDLEKIKQIAELDEIREL